MNILDGSERVLPWCVLAVSALLVSPAAWARAGHSDSWARDKYAAAERMHEVLNKRPSAERSRQDYQRVIDAFRLVYFGAPASSKADPAVFAVAQLLTEMGQQFDDDKILHSAIEQYRFLRREYPGSKHRCDALFMIAEIYKDDLDQPHQARSAYEELLRRYPTHRLAPDARQALGEIGEQSANKQTQSNKEARKDPGLRERRFSDTAADEANHDQHPGDEKASAESKSGNTARVSGILHWSTPDYTRVAIELDQKV